MPIDPASAAVRFERFAADVLAPAIFSHACPLDVSVFQSQEPVPLAAAASAAYSPVSVGWDWGPVWSTAWFRIRGSVPRALVGQRVYLRFATGTEALVYRDSAPLHALDLNRDAVELFPAATEGDRIDLLVEAACNHHLGQLGTHWDPAEFLARWQREKPGRLERCEIAAFHEDAWKLHWSFQFALQLARELPASGARAHELIGALEHAARLVDPRAVAPSAPAALAALHAVLLRGAAPSAPICHAVGHAHIDTAWLWPIRETRRKCVRTFATALANLDRFPQFRFLCSQAQQYAWLEHDAPDLFQRIRARVADGSWEPGGAMWIEPDCNLVSGESLVRQVVHAVRYWTDRFDHRGVQRHVYLPDTFGFTGALPQIMKLAGLDTFITHKLSWNQTTRFPHTHFVWRGIDGSEVLAHQMPGHDYNLRMTPRELRRGEQNHENKHLAGVLRAAHPDADHAPRYLQPFGFGDGGGGPTDWQVYFSQLAEACEGVPRTRFTRVDDFCARLHADRAALQRLNLDFPTHDGELYLEAHRGTYTTQAWIKLANRRLEESLRAAEALAVCTPTPPTADDRAALDAAWKTVLLHQFHDILPGSSIGWVYDDAQTELSRVRESIDARAAASLAALAATMDAGAAVKPLVVFNPTSAPQSMLVEHAGELVWAENVPPLGVTVVDAARAAPLPLSGPARFIGHAPMRIGNGLIECDLDPGASIIGLRLANSTRELCAPGHTLAQLVLYEDHPRHWDAWDIDAEYEQHPAPVVFEASGVAIEEMGPWRVRVTRRAAFGRRSTIQQEIILDAGSPRLDIRTTIDWQEKHRLLRVLFPTSLRAPCATYEGAFGFVQRSTRRSTPAEQAMFEVPAHRWTDLSDDAGDAGLAIINDSKYGHSCHAGVLGMSLLRAPTFPDPDADAGFHRFAYSLLPHAGDWRAAAVDSHAELVNAPRLAWAIPHAQRAPHAAHWAPFDLQSAGGGRATIAALKPAEDGDRLILRLVETRGRHARVRISWRLPVAALEPVDLLERPILQPRVRHNAPLGVTELDLAPFQILTLSIARA